MAESYRAARPDEIPQLARLAGHSFVGRTQEQAEATVAGAAGGLDSVWVGLDSATSRPVALTLLHAFHQWVGGAELPMMGLGLVTVSPTHRRRGVAARLVTSGLRRALERGDMVSALYPFRAAFYEGLGYGLAGEAMQYVVAPSELRDRRERVGIRSVESDADVVRLQEVYARWARQENGQLRRTPAMWTKALTERAAFLWESEAGEVEGYVFVRYRADLPPESRYLEVEERVWLSRAARLGIFGWLASLGDQWARIVYRAHPDEHFSDQLREPRLPLGAAPGWGLWFPAATLLLGPMFRLVDFSRAWTRRAVAADASLEIGCEVADEQLPENAGAWTLRFSEGRVEVTRGTRSPADGTLRCTIADHSRLFIGSASVARLVESGAAEFDRPDRIEAVDRALQIRRPWTFDRF